jgi:hypothetical protein
VAFALAQAAGAQLPNDNICTATPVGDGTSLHSNVGALVPALGGCVTLNSDVWFVYNNTFLFPGNRTFSTCGAYGTLADTVLEVFEGSLPCTALPVGCNDDSCGLRSSVTVPVSSTQAYFIRVADYGGLLASDQGTFPLTITGPPPPNDECVGAVEVFAPGGVTPYSNMWATNSGSVTVFCDIPYNSDVWFKWVATCTGTATFATCAPPSPVLGLAPLDDTVIQVLSGTCSSLLGFGQNCSDDACGSNGLKSRVSVPVTAGLTYYIRVADFGSDARYGTFTLSIDCCPGSFTSIATGCGSPTFTPVLTTSGAPCLGESVAYDLSPPGPATYPLIWIGFPTSFPLCPPEPCSLGATLLFVFPVNSLSATIPNDPNLSGLVLAVQGGVLFSSFGCPASAFGVAFRVSNTIQTTIG